MMIEKVSDECETCRKLQRNPEQLVVGFALGKVFNEAIERGVGGREIPLSVATTKQSLKYINKILQLF